MVEYLPHVFPADGSKPVQADVDVCSVSDEASE